MPQKSAFVLVDSYLKIICGFI